jgi:hypothetical protein
MARVSRPVREGRARGPTLSSTASKYLSAGSYEYQSNSSTRMARYSTPRPLPRMFSRLM